MNSVKTYILLFITTVFCISCEKKEIENFTDLIFKSDTTIQYKVIKDVDPNLLSLDIYTVDNSKLYRPVVIWVHGGGWAIGDKKNSLENKISLFQNERYVFVSTNYRLSPFPYQVENTNKVQYPDHVVDLADALTWIYNNIYKYGGDTTKLAIIGHSAGAHLAALLATDQKWLFANHLNPLILRGVAPLDTEGFNLVSRINRDSAELFLNAFTLDEVAWHEASPLFQIENNEILPPNWLVVERGTNERKEILNEFITKLQTTNAKVTKVIANQYSHEDVNQKIGETGENILTPALKKFLLDCFQ